MIRSFRLSLPFLVFLLCNSCATYIPQSSVEPFAQGQGPKKNISHTFYLAGGFGNAQNAQNTTVSDLLRSHLKEATSKSTLIFTGDNVSEEAGNWQRNKSLVDQQLELVKGFKGKTIFLPGNNEWKSYNTDKIERVEEYLDSLDNDNIKFYPENICPIEHKVINDQLDMILIDSKWFISNWSRIKNINKKCTDIVTRRRFMEELEGYINDGQGKNIVIAMHHPIFSNGKYAGKDSFKSHMTPLPAVGTIINGVNHLGAFSPDRLNSRRYNYLRIAVSSLAKASKRITVVSGHEESLQFLSGGDINQIISGSLSDKTATKISKDKINTIGGSLDFKGKFTHGEKGFAKLVYYEDGSSQVFFITPDKNQKGFDVLPKLSKGEGSGNFPKIAEEIKKDAVLDEREALDKSAFYEFLWGERYRRYFGKSVSAPIAKLDTLYGGLEVVKKGGGHQSYSIRLKDKNGREYAMRSLRKNALKFLKFKIPGIAYTEDDYDDTFTEEVISDFFTTAHPYMQLVINPLARSIGVNHSSPTLFYIPKQERLGRLNDEFGDELYFIEERPSDEQMGHTGYKRSIDESGEVKEFESTTDMLEKIKSDESYSVDQKDFIRARVFDMLIGDWDRHQDQWRWVEYEKEDGDKEFLPVPRDRDNAFPKFDGAAMKFIKLFVPNSRRWQSFGPDIQNVKWLNIGGNKIDRAILTKYSEHVWEEEAKFIQQHLTDEAIAKAFQNLPDEVQDQTASQMEQNLKARLKRLPQYARAYGKYLNKIISLHGTEKDDKIEVVRMPNGQTKVILRRLISDGVNEKMFERIFDSDETKELWIYGLGDDDVFEVKGEGDSNIFIRLIGGYGEDIYQISNSQALRVYDWKHENITLEDKKPATTLSDVYQTNTFHWRFFEESNNILVPNIGFRSDDGTYLGLKDTFIYNGFNGNKFKQKHSLAANYYFKFRAIEFAYNGVYANIFPKWNLETYGYFTNNRFSNNFFGMGNESVNREDDLGRSYYRARMQKVRLNVGIAYHTLRFKALYESFKTRELPDRFFVPGNLDPRVFGSQNYIGLETSALYDNSDAKDFPSKSIVFGLTAGYKANTGIGENKFGYLKFKAGFSHKLIPSGHLVFGTLGEVKTNFGNNYFFYHAATLGGNNGLRGFRDERFAGKTYFYQTSDLRLRVKRYITAVAPITVGLYAGFDYGRVWTENDISKVWYTSQGGGLWVSGFNFLAFNAGYFNSVEGNIIQVGFGFEF